MNVIAINGSPRREGNTAFALMQTAKVLEDEGIAVEAIQIGNLHIRGCIACNQCYAHKDEKCIFLDDIVNDTLHKMKEADGIILASPVYYSGIAGTMKCFLDRCFYVSNANGNLFRHKVGASIVAVRRTGGTMTFHGLNQYLTVSEMLLPASNYWNIIHGRNIGDAAADAEGIQIMQVLGKNMAWMLKMKEQTKHTAPAAIKNITTDLIR
jgi:multimeric flavodoxin WrbA